MSYLLGGGFNSGCHVTRQALYHYLLFGSTGAQTQGLVLVRRELYHFNHTLSPVCFSNFSNRVFHLARASLDHDLLIYPPSTWEDRCAHHAQLICLDVPH
jgi:hypothetical protein